MKELWLIKIGEISLKKGNRGYFERILKENIKRRFAEINAFAQINIRHGRYYLNTTLDKQTTAEILRTTPGIVAFSRAVRVKKNLDALFAASLDMARQNLSKERKQTYKFEVRRVDKSLPLDCYAYARELGNMMGKALPELRVDVKNPDFCIRVELREWGYVYQNQQPGPGGLPVGTGGRGLLLLSGGIDSPVAGYLMAKRGLKLAAIHFSTPPYTGDEAHEKVERLSAALAPWCGGLSLLSVPFTACQLKIKQSVERSALTLHTRACMMRIAEICAAKRRYMALVTGESLGQVASQTLESLAYTNSSVHLPIFRPLIGMDKEQITHLAKSINTYSTSVEPFEDCCSLFSPDRPLARPNLSSQQSMFDSIEGLEEMMDETVSKSHIIRFDSHGERVAG
ncbi:MAG: tRNA 4-thiouridine(8) synthase ThiI [spirochete symbiont of Stewartia floridana]|nr:MAG: tRNA 4-thiouridine(8) synthase ThiI [spirochete symbiont of Stewartia floridana]